MYETSAQARLINLSSGTLGLIVILSSFSVAIVLCTGICLALWCRKLKSGGNDPSPANLIVQRQPRLSSTSSGHVKPNSMSLILPTVSYSEAGSEPVTPASTLNSADRYSGRSRLSTPNFTPVDSPISEITPSLWKFPPTDVVPDNYLHHYFTPPYKNTTMTRSAPTTPFTPSLPNFRWRNDVRSWPSQASSPEVRCPTLYRAPGGLGELNVRVIYKQRLQHLKVLILSAHNLPQRFHDKTGNLYVKMILSEEDRRLKFQSGLVPASGFPTFCVSFIHCQTPQILSNSTITISVCQEEESGRRVVAGSAFLSLGELGLLPDQDKEVDSGHLMLSLKDSSPEQQVDCGGEIRLGIGWNEETECLNLSNIIISKFDLNKICRKCQDLTDEDDLPWVYMKVCVYVRSTLSCWRRTRPVPLYPDLTPLEDTLHLHLPKSQMPYLNLVLSIRQKTELKGGRRVLGSVSIGSGSDCMSGRTHWRTVMEGGQETVTLSHVLSHN